MFTRYLICLLAGLEAATLMANPVRATPTRPAAGNATTVVNPREYLKTEDVAARHSLEHSWLEPQKRVLLKDARTRIEIEAGSRAMRVNGVRVFLGDPARLVEGGMRLSRVDSERLLPGLLGRVADGRRELRTIAIDAGHGGTDTGTQNAALGLREKVFSLDVALRLKRLLEKQGYRVAMTRETDIDVGLGARAIIANQAKADLFISIHFNSVLNDTKTSGSEVFTFAPQFQRSTNAWGPGQRDDTEALPAPVNRFDTLSVACAHAIHRALLDTLKAADRGQKIAHWGVLRPLNCPGVLVEAGFLSNEAEGKKIATPEYRQQIAEAIAEGVKAYAAVVAGAEKK